MFTDNSTTDVFPKTLLIRNSYGGLVWQIYHVENKKEALYLSEGAENNGFESRELVEHTKEEETFPDWRETQGGKLIIEKSKE